MTPSEENRAVREEVQRLVTAGKLIPVHLTRNPRRLSGWEYINTDTGEVLSPGQVMTRVREGIRAQQRGSADV